MNKKVMLVALFILVLFSMLAMAVAGRSRFLQNSDIVQLGRKLHEINAERWQQ